MAYTFIRHLSIVLLVIAAATGAHAQAPTYVALEADTLHYREQTSEVRMRSWPEQEREVTTTHNAEIAVAFSENESAQATFDSLYIRITSDQGLSEPLTRGALGKPFELQFGPDGNVETVDTPSFPQVLLDVSDLRWWFEDFFLPLPDRPLTVGMTWKDTLRIEHGLERSVRRTGRYTVTRDTVVRGIPSYVVDFAAERAVRSRDTRQAFPDANAGSTLSGQERGTAYVAVNRPVLVGLSLTGTLTGEWNSSAGSSDLVVPEQVEYTRLLELTRKP